MWVEKLEARQLLSATSPATMAIHARHVHEHSIAAPLEVSKKPGTTLAEVESALLNDAIFNVLLNIGKFNGPTALQEFGFWLLISNSPAKSRGASIKATAAPSFTLTMQTPTDAQTGNYSPFLPSFIAPFGPSFTFTLNARNPLKLFNIKQKMVGRTLTFTGTLSKNLQTITGKLKIVGKNYFSTQTYTATPGA